MTEYEKLREKINTVIGDGLINCGITHENPPPHKDCGEDCGVRMEDQIAASNPLCSPVRSGGKKHRKCMDCWNEYITNLVKQILALSTDTHKIVILPKELAIRLGL